MAKIRVYRLAEDLNCSVKDMLVALEKVGIEVKSHMDTLNEDEVNTIKNSTLVVHDNLAADDFKKAWKVAQSKIKRPSRSSSNPPASTGKNTPEIAAKPLEDKRIEIQDGETGHTYENLFGEYLKNAKSILVEDNYIRNPHQIKNFVRFCRMLEDMGEIEKIHLITGFDAYMSRNDAIKAFEDLQNSLKKYNISFLYEFNDKIHDRKIETDDGWVIDLGKGLDIYKPPGSWYKIESEDYERRACVKTTINITRIIT